MERLERNEQSWRKTLAAAAAYYSQHKEYLSNLLIHTTGYDSFIVNMTEIHQKVLLKTMERLLGPEAVNEDVRIYGQIYCYGTVLFSCDWILGKYSLSEKELADVYENALPEQLARCIRKA